MNNFHILYIEGDGYDRFTKIRNNENVYCVHFLEFNEYLENNKSSIIRCVGDNLEGELFIDCVCFSKISKKPLMYFQDIDETTTIKAIVEIVSIIDKYSVLVHTNICKDNIIV